MRTCVDEEDGILTTAEAARLLHKAPQTLRKWRSAGGGPPYHRLGNTTRARAGYLKSDLRAWLEARRFCHTTDEDAVALGASGSIKADTANKGGG